MLFRKYNHPSAMFRVTFDWVYSGTKIAGTIRKIFSFGAEYITSENRLQVKL